MKKILLTFDYEVFFVKTGSVENCLLRPVDELLKVLDECKYKVTFFVDTLFLEKLCIYKIAEYKLIEQQLKDIVRAGHRIELHLHPHWLDAVYEKEKNQWKFSSYKHYMLSSLSSEIIMTCFCSGVDLLNSIARTVIPDYTVLAFRAGGWCVEPFVRLREGFRQSGIVIDSSVAKGIRINTDTHKVDFSTVPGKIFYRFSESVCKEHNAGEFFEIPITTYRVGFLKKLLNAYRKKKLPLDKKIIFGDGQGIVTKKYTTRFGLLCYFMRAKNRVEMYTIDNTILVSDLINSIQNNKKDVVTLIAHPKSLTTEAFKFIRGASLKGFEFITIDKFYFNCIKQ